MKIIENLAEIIDYYLTTRVTETECASLISLYHNHPNSFLSQCLPPPRPAAKSPISILLLYKISLFLCMKN